MTWIEINRTDANGIPRGLPRRAPYMDTVLSDHDYDPDEHLPIDYTANRKANVPEPLAAAITERYDHATRSD